MTNLNSVKSVVGALLITILSSGAVFAQGSVEAGRAKSTTCVACHGDDGNASLLPNVPRIGGQGEKYLFKQLVEIKNDVRPVPLMKPVVDPLSEQDLADLAAYYASLDAPAGATDPEQRALAEAIYRAGVPSIGVAACTACHSPNGQGIATAGYPALSGQDAAYTELQLRQFRAGERINDDAQVMRMIASRLSDAEIAALASYVSGLR